MTENFPSRLMFFHLPALISCLIRFILCQAGAMCKIKARRWRILNKSRGKTNRLWGGFMRRGIILEDVRVKYYALPLCLAGLATAVYHNLVYYGAIPETMTPCSQGVSCADTQLELFGFITIPLLSLGAFAVIAVCLWFYKSKE
jgi:disulfide bond formation protein DsbB